ncbi:MAG: divergent polysaccharide deacetylase family protein [Desulfobacteraceae bacterium]|nr:divergent polysaccharide deacetylase family protein [Desulfobacteraceae bacterium]
MAKRKTSKKRSVPRKKRSKRNTQKKQILRIILGLSLLIVLVLFAVVAANHFLMRNPATASVPPSVIDPVSPDSHLSKPPFEVFPEEPPVVQTPATPVPEISTPAVKPPGVSSPRVAIIIDDLGYDRGLGEKFIDLDGIFTFSVLPKAPFTKKLAEAAHKNGHEVMLHQPMEPNEYPEINPGPGTLYTAMSPDELLSLLNENLDDLPFVKGVNNHMGSKMTTETPQLRQIFSVIKKRELYFIDSRTSALTKAKDSARLLKIPFAERDVFIDHYDDTDFIHRQLLLLIKTAEQNGSAVGICHPHPATLKVLKEMLPEIRKKVRLVPASEVVGEIV